MTDLTIPAKSIERQFKDWESWAFGYGYGTGELHTLAALKTFMALIPVDEDSRAYDYKELEAALGGAAAWLMIARFCEINVLEYGTSPRYAWLTSEGEKLKAFVDAHTVEQLIGLVRSEHDDVCYPTACNCGPDGYVKGRKCSNVFWGGRAL